MAPRKKRNDRNIPIGELVRIAIDMKLREFLNAHDQVELQFPNSFTAVERAYIHVLVRKHGLKSKSRGTGVDRFLTIYKRDGSTIIQADATFGLTAHSVQTIHCLLSKFPLTTKEQIDTAPATDKISNTKHYHREPRPNTGQLNNGIPLIPTITTNPELKAFRNSLPVTTYKDNILRLLNDNQVVLISGATGSGKTTQIPQFIMDESATLRKPCRIVCTQPRRLSAISVCERVAHERNVSVGQSVGYQIRLESRVSPQTILIYCTTGVLLRTLMGTETCFSAITHIIVDEIHERDKFCDYLLIVLRECLHKYPKLKLVLMSATIDTDIFTRYFESCPTIKIPGRLFPVSSYFLEDVLKMTSYTNSDMKKFAVLLKGKKTKEQSEESWTQSFKKLNVSNSSEINQTADIVPNTSAMDNDLKDLMDKSLEEFWTQGTADSFGQILHLILTENVSVNYQHRSIGCTILMLTAGRGFAEHTEQILNLGADVKLRSCNNWTAYDWAMYKEETKCAELILAYTSTSAENISSRVNDLQYKDTNPEDQELLEAYSHSFNSDEEIDHNLIMHIIQYIHCKNNDGGILVFLPGYEDIIQLRDLILKDDKIQDKPFQLFILHSNMHTIDHKQVFCKLHGIRKIILSTNIAQTSITIDDVVYVIDAGKVKELTFDGVSGTTCLRANWISRACAMQRAGRAGRVRPGECFHLFSSARYNEMMQKFSTPDILRTPLQELCLQTKLLAPVNMPIAEFLDKAVEPPPAMVTRQAVQLLKTMGALNEFEELTEMGTHLVDLPIEPKLAKMLMYGVVLKCLDPILTIVCCLAHRDPFIIPSQPTDKRAQALCRKQFSADTYSDHMVLLRVFQSWQNARTNKVERQFCTRNFLNAATMEQIVSTRLQMLGQLRASGFVKARGPGDVKDLNIYSENWAVIKAAITASLYPALCRIDKDHMTLRTQNENKVLFHPSSVLRSGLNPYKHTPSSALTESLKAAPSEWMVYEEKSRVGPWCHVKTVTMVTPLTVALFGGPMRGTLLSEKRYPEISSDSDSESETPQANKPADTNDTKSHIYALDNWAVFKLDAEIGNYVHDLRKKWNAMFIRRMANPMKNMTMLDEAVLEAVVKVLTEEEQKSNFVQPLGIGQRPRAMTTEDMSPNVFQSFACHKAPHAKKPSFKNGSSCSRASDGSSSNSSNFSAEGNKLLSAIESPKKCGDGSIYKVVKYFIFKMVPAGNGKAAHKSDFKVDADYAVFFRKVLQAGGRIYLIFLSSNKPKFEGVAEVINRNRNYNNSSSPKSKMVQLQWWSRLTVPTAASGIGASMDLSTIEDGYELEDEFGKALVDYLISYKPVLYNSNDQYYVRAK